MYILKKDCEHLETAEQILCKCPALTYKIYAYFCEKTPNLPILGCISINKAIELFRSLIFEGDGYRGDGRLVVINNSNTIKFR